MPQGNARESDTIGGVEAIGDGTRYKRGNDIREVSTKVSSEGGGRTIS